MFYFRTLIFSLSLGCAAPVKAEPIMSMSRGFTVSLEDLSGRVLPVHSHRGGAFIEGRMGEAYVVRFDNPTAQRVEVVATVDGRDVVSGEPGDYARQRGYIVEPFGSLRIQGFRRSLSEIAQFRFTGPGDSYSSRRGTPENVGVIGVAVFGEAAPPPTAYRNRDDSDTEPSKSAQAPAMEAPADERGNLGTQFGETRGAPVVEVPFVRARPSAPDAVLAAYYDDRGGLIRRGIISQPVLSLPGPQPFPENQRFAAPPP